MKNVNLKSFKIAKRGNERGDMISPDDMQYFLNQLIKENKDFDIEQVTVSGPGSFFDIFLIFKVTDYNSQKERMVRVFRVGKRGNEIVGCGFDYYRYELERILNEGWTSRGKLTISCSPSSHAEFIAIHEFER